MSNNPLIRTMDLEKTYVTEAIETPALRGVSMELHTGEFTAVAGPSGSGKSTLMFDNLGCNVISYDTVPFFVDTVQALSSERTHTLQWGDWGIGKIRRRFDLLFIDGPAGGDNREESYRVGSQVNTKFIACHDAHRKWESKWIEKYLSDKELVASMDDSRIKVYKNAAN